MKNEATFTFSDGRKVSEQDVNQMANHVLHLVSDVKSLSEQLTEAGSLNYQLLQQNSALVQHILDLQDQMRNAKTLH